MKAFQRPWTRGLFAIWLSFVAAGSSIAGFSNDLVTNVVIGPRDESVPLDESYITSPIPQADVDRIKLDPFFSAMSDAQVQAYVVALRRVLLGAIGLIKGENTALGDGLEQCYRSDGICLGLAPPGHCAIVETLSDQEAGFNRSDLINVYPLRGLTGAATDYNLFRLYDALTRAGRYATQDQTLGKGPKYVEDAAASGVQVAVNEESLNRQAAMKAVLESIRDTNQIPQGAVGPTAILGRAVKVAGNPVLVQSWLLGLQLDRAVQENRYTAYSTDRRLAELGVEGHPDFSSVLDTCRVQRGAYCYSYPTDSANVVYRSPPAQLLEVGGGGFDVLRQATVEVISGSASNYTQSFLISGMESVSDIFRTPTDIFISAVNYSSGTGVVRRHGVDLENGGINVTFSAEYESALFADGLALSWEPTTDRICGLNRKTGEFYEFPFFFGPSVTPIGFAAPSDTLYGYRECRWGESDTVVVSGHAFEEWTTFDAEPSTCCSSGSSPFFLEPCQATGTAVRPCIQFPDDYVTECLEVAGTPGFSFSLTAQFGGGPASVIGSGVFSPGTGRCTLPIAANITTVTPPTLHVVDGEGRTSAGVTPSLAPVVPRLGFVRDSSGGFTLQTKWNPGTLVSFVSGNSPVPGAFVNVIRTAQADRSGQYFGAVPGLNVTNSESAFFRCEASGAVPVPIATPDTFSCVPGVTTMFNCAENDADCPIGTYYELVSAPGLPEGAFEFHSDGTCKVTMLNFFGGATFSYRPIYRKVAGEVVDVGLFEDSGALTNPEEFIGIGGIPWVVVPCLYHAGEFFPLYQFYLRPPDNCFFIHWHWRFGVQVYSFENPTVPVDDPFPSVCGFGIFGLVPILPQYYPKAVFTQFLNDHP